MPTQVLQLNRIKSDRIRLRSGDTTMGDCRAAVFGELVQLTLTKLENYHSDLYHDANWLRECMPEEADTFSFFYVVRNWGTHIGTDPTLVRQATDPALHQAYACKVFRISHTFYFEWTEI